MWKEGQLLPEGFDQMDLPTKVRRGSGAPALCAAWVIGGVAAAQVTWAGAPCRAPSHSSPPRPAVLRCRPSAPLTQVYQLYMGERGLVFWANKAALASIVFLIVAWIAFRFLGPALGLYQLQQDFSTPNF